MLQPELTTQRYRMLLSRFQAIFTNRTSRQAVQMTALRFIGLGIGAVAQIYAARQLGPEKLGISGMLLPIMLYEAIALSATEPPFPPVLFLVSHLGLLLMAASILSLGMFISALTDSTLLAAVFTFVLVLILWILQGIGNTAGGGFGAVASHLSLLRHYDNFVNGVLDSSSVVLFLTYIILGIFLTAQTFSNLVFQPRSIVELLQNTVRYNWE